MALPRKVSSLAQQVSFQATLQAFTVLFFSNAIFVRRGDGNNFVRRRLIQIFNLKKAVCAACTPSAHRKNPFQACKHEALDCFPKGNHDHPKGDNLVLCTSMILFFYKVKSNKLKSFIFNFSIILSFMAYLLAQTIN